MPPPPGSTYKIGLVGTGIHLVHAIEALRAVPSVTIAIVADASDRSEGGKLAKSLQLPVVKNAMEVFKTEANIVLEVTGDERQYERLLSIKPPGVEVMSVRGARLLMDLLKKAEVAPGAGEGGGPAAPGPAPDGIHTLEPLTAALEEALRHTGAPGDAAKAMLPGIARATGMEFAALAMPGTGGALSWIVAAPESMALSRLPADKVRQVLGPGRAPLAGAAEQGHRDRRSPSAARRGRSGGPPAGGPIGGQRRLAGGAPGLSARGGRGGLLPAGRSAGRGLSGRGCEGGRARGAGRGGPEVRSSGKCRWRS